MTEEAAEFDDFYRGTCHCFLFLDPRRQIWEFVFVWRKGVHIFHSQQEVSLFFRKRAEELKQEFGDGGFNWEGICKVVKDLPEVDRRYPTENIFSYTAILAFMALGDQMEGNSAEEGEKDSPENVSGWLPSKEPILA